jgi:hypothetical protein
LERSVEQGHVQEVAMPYFTVIAALLATLAAASATAPLHATSLGGAPVLASDDRSYDAWDDDDDDDDDDGRDAYNYGGDLDDDDDDDGDDSAHGPDDDGDWDIEEGPRNVRA